MKCVGNERSRVFNLLLTFIINTLPSGRGVVMLVKRSLKRKSDVNRGITFQLKSQMFDFDINRTEH